MTNFCLFGFSLLIPSAPHADVHHFDKQGEGYGKVNVALGDFVFEAFEEKHKADEDKEAEREHFHGRMAVNEIADFSGEYHHNADGNDDGKNHDEYLVGQAYGRQDGIKREDDVN